MAEFASPEYSDAFTAAPRFQRTRAQTRRARESTRRDETTMTTFATDSTTTNMMPMQILLADDHPLFREALRRLLETDPAIRVIGEAEDGREAIKIAAELRP